MRARDDPTAELIVHIRNDGTAPRAVPVNIVARLTSRSEGDGVSLTHSRRGVDAGIVVE